MRQRDDAAAVVRTDAAFRAAMRRFAAPVVAITAGDGLARRGVTVSSFTFVSELPPLVSFCLRVGCRMLSVIEPARHFAVQIVDRGDVDVLRRFAMPGLSSIEQFEGIACDDDPLGAPVLRVATTVLVARVCDIHRAGDHEIIIGEALAVRHRGDASPLVHFERQFRELGNALPVRV
jgi:flavin reductase (DIM6/NTAB) family NADH-FMN oxidoreductase RutF